MCVTLSLPVQGDYAYAISDETGVTQINTATMTVSQRVEVGATVIQVVASEQGVFVLDDMNTLHIYDARDMRLMDTLTFDFIPFSLVYDRAHDAVHMLGLYDRDHSNGVIAAISATSYQLLHIAEVLSFPFGIALQAEPQVVAPLGMQVQGMHANIVKCINDTSEQEVYIPHQVGDTVWSCEQQGMQIRQGDTVTIGVKGDVAQLAPGVIEPLGMRVQRMDVSFVQCLNNTTEQTVTFVPQPEQVMWDCEQYGLQANIGESVIIKANGIVR